MCVQHFTLADYSLLFSRWLWPNSDRGPSANSALPEYFKTGKICIFHPYPSTSQWIMKTIIKGIPCLLDRLTFSVISTLTTICWSVEANNLQIYIFFYGLTHIYYTVHYYRSETKPINVTQFFTAHLPFGKALVVLY